jgi:hypothetical protein
LKKRNEGSLDGDLVIGKPKRALLYITQMTKLNGWNVPQIQGLRRQKATVTRDNQTCFINQDGIGEAKLGDGSHDLLNLPFGMGSGVPGIGINPLEWPIDDCQ